jgi:hypothetical protein
MQNFKNKKIRGWNRRIKHIQVWYNSNKEFNFNHFNQYREDYVKIQIHPWNRLGYLIPPNWYFKLIIEKLISIHALWMANQELKKANFDLQIWLFDKVSVRSQIVCALVDQKAQLRDNYFNKSNDKKIFPINRWQSKNYDLSNFNWQLYDDEDFWFKNLSSLSNQEVQELENNGFVAEEIEINGEPEIRYSKKVGHVWIGRLKDYTTV